MDDDVRMRIVSPSIYCSRSRSKMGDLIAYLHAQQPVQIRQVWSGIEAMPWLQIVWHRYFAHRRAPRFAFPALAYVLRL